MENAVEEKKKNDGLKAVFEWLELLAVSVACVVVILTLIARYSPVNGTSMNETLQNKDVLVLSNLFYTPKNGDIIVFESAVTGYDEPYVKRIIATAGQTVNIDFDTWTITVDGEEPEWEKHATYKGVERLYYNADITYPYTVPDDCVFVMGDNRWNSRDSRDIGPVETRTILGRVVCRVFPFSDFGKVD